MPNIKNGPIDKIKRNLFLATEDIKEHFTSAEHQRRKRIQLCITKKLDNPIITDKEIIDYMFGGCDGTCKNISSSQAYRDLLVVNQITGNIRLAAKDYERYMVVETAKAEIAKFRGKDGKAVAALLKVIIMARGLDKEDNEIVFDKLIPPNFEPTPDASILGDQFRRIQDPDRRREQLRAIFNSRQVEETQYTEE
jgi:hypothetical protein